jgi:hypothetical protein
VPVAPLLGVNDRAVLIVRDALDALLPEPLTKARAREERQREKERVRRHR